MNGLTYGRIPTQDISNLLGLKFCSEYLALCAHIERPGRPLTKIIQFILGKQDHCWVGGSENRRFYIWRFRELWILVHNQKGLCLEVPMDITAEEAAILWADVCLRFGFDIHKARRYASEPALFVSEEDSYGFSI
jgi:hypothetical protein